MKKMMMAMAACCALSFGMSTIAHADNETLGEKAKEGWEDTKKGTKKAWRNAKGEWCEMVNGKAECAMKKAGNSIKNGVDEVKDKADVKQ